MANILVVDDRPTNCYYLRALLEAFGHSVSEAYDGEEALEQITEHSPDIVITDIIMPKLDGYELARRLRSDPSIVSIPIIFYTATFDKQSAISLARGCGVKFVMSKPADPPEILNAVYRSLGLPLPPEIKPSGESVIWRDEDSFDWSDQGYAEISQVTRKKLAKIIHLGTQAALERDARRLLERYCEIAQTVTGAKFAVLAFPRSDGLGHLQFVRKGLELFSEAAVKIEAPDRVELFRSRLPLRATDIHDDMAAFGLPASHPIVDHILAVEVASPHNRSGWLYVANPVGTLPFTADDELTVEFLASQAGVAFENLQLTEEIQHDAMMLRSNLEELRELEAKLRRRTAEVAEWTERYEAAVLSTGQVIYDFVPATNSLSLGGYVEEMLGYTSAEVPRTMEALNKLIHPSELDSILALRCAAAERNEPFIAEYRIRTKDRGFLQVLDRGRVLLEEGGGVRRVIGFFSDVTQQRKAQQLEDEKKLLRRELEQFQQKVREVGLALREPITVVRTSAEKLVSSDGSDAVLREPLLKTIREKAVVLASLVDELSNPLHCESR